MTKQTFDRYMLVHLIDKQSVGSEMEFIPLHLTLVPWFYTDVTQEKMVSLFGELARKFGKFTIRVLGEHMLGPEQNIPANMVEKTTDLNRLHTELLACVEDIDAKQTSEWVGENWRPHITHKRKIGAPKGTERTQQLHEGDTINFDSVDLIASRHVQSERVIVGRFNLE